MQRNRSSSEECSESFSWTGFHESRNRDKSDNDITINAILPVLDHVSHSQELQFHLMKTTVTYTRYLNPDQIAVGCSDQPLYALKKMIQWNCADMFSDVYFASMGPLHIEQAVMVCIGLLINYAKCASVFIQDLKSLKMSDERLYDKFMSEAFAVNTAGISSSKIGYDQSQEHNNKKVKSTAGYIDLVNNEDTIFLRKLEVCLPEIHKYLTSIKDDT